MIETAGILHAPEDLVAIRVHGTITKEDYDLVVPQLEKKIATHGKIRLYAEVGELDGLSAAALWQDLKFDIKHAGHFKKIAVVADQPWLDWLSKAGQYFTSAEVKVFHHNQQQEAHQWVVS